MSTEREQIERLIEAGAKLRGEIGNWEPNAKEWDALVAEIKSPWSIGRSSDYCIIGPAEFLCYDSKSNASSEVRDWLLALLRKHAPEGMTKEVER